MAMIVASFWVHRPFEFPNAADYPAMLRILQRSCDRLGLRHVVLTDRATRFGEAGLWPRRDDDLPIEGRLFDLPVPLMKAVTSAQAQWLYEIEAREEATLFVGADCIMLRQPTEPPGCHLAVTYRNPTARYPINTGAVFARPHKRVRGIFKTIATICGETWCDDQRAIRNVLDPMPATYGNYGRAGLQVAFRPMHPFNVLPRDLDDRCEGAQMVHFRGKARKQFLFDWAKRWGYA